MADQYAAPFGTYTLSGQGLSGGQKTAINACIGGLSTLLGASQPPSHPDFDKINPGTRQKILDEITALQAAVTAST